MERSIGRLISILYRKSQVCLNAVLKPLNLTASELPILAYLFKHEGASQEELSSFLVIDKASTARGIQLLIQKGFLRKEKNPVDRRANKIFLTEYALGHKEQLRTALLHWNAFLIEGIDAQSVDITFATLESMVQKLESASLKETWENQ